MLHRLLLQYLHMRVNLREASRKKNKVQNNGKETLENGYDILALAFPMLESVKHQHQKEIQAWQMVMIWVDGKLFSLPNHHPNNSHFLSFLES